MQTASKTFRNSANQGVATQCLVPMRRGSATLEFVLSMPILLAIIVGIVWLGTSVIAQTEVTIKARHDSWVKRDEPTGKALLFLKDDVVSEKAEKKVDVSPLFDDVESPESSHQVMVSAWDHEKLPLEKAPNWKQYALAAINAKSGSLQNRYVDGTNQFNQFKSEAGNIWQSLAVGLIRELTGLGGAADSALGGGESTGAAEKERERSKIQRKLELKKESLRKARAELRNLDDDASDTLKKVLKNRIKRLKDDVDNLEDDLGSLE